MYDNEKTPFLRINHKKSSLVLFLIMHYSKLFLYKCYMVTLAHVLLFIKYLAHLNILTTHTRTHTHKHILHIDTINNITGTYKGSPGLPKQSSGLHRLFSNKDIISIATICKQRIKIVK